MCEAIQQIAFLTLGFLIGVQYMRDQQQFPRETVDPKGEV